MKTIIWPCLKQAVLVPLLPAVAWLLLPPSLWRLLLVCTASLASTVLVSYTITLDKDEKNLVLSIIRKFTGKFRKSRNENASNG